MQLFDQVKTSVYVGAFFKIQFMVAYAWFN